MRLTVAAFLAVGFLSRIRSFAVDRIDFAGSSRLCVGILGVNAGTSSDLVRTRLDVLSGGIYTGSSFVLVCCGSTSGVEEAFSTMTGVCLFSNSSAFLLRGPVDFELAACPALNANRSGLARQYGVLAFRCASSCALKTSGLLISAVPSFVAHKLSRLSFSVQIASQ